jgi:hypothetical protein
MATYRTESSRRKRKSCDFTRRIRLRNTFARLSRRGAQDVLFTGCCMTSAVTFAAKKERHSRTIDSFIGDGTRGEAAGSPGLTMSW